MVLANIERGDVDVGAYVKGHTHDLVSVIDVRFGLDLCLKVSILVEEGSERSLGSWNPGRIVRIFVGKIDNLE